MDSLRKVRDIVGRHANVDTVEGDEDAHALPKLTDSVAFNADVDVLAVEEVGTSKIERLKDKAKHAKYIVAHPHQAAKQRAQKTMLKSVIRNERPWLGDQKSADDQLFEAYDDLDREKVENGKKSTEQGPASSVHYAEGRVQSLEDKRTELEVAWHLSRYVRRARVVRRPLDYPPKERYQQYDSQGNHERFLWVKWVGHVLLYGFQDAALQYIDPTNTISYDREELTRVVERLLVVSQAFQDWWGRVRKVYRWEDRWLTLTWLVLFFVLLKTGYFMSFYWAYLFYSFTTNRHGKHSRYWMRELDNRATQTRDTATTLSELIMRHGADAWFEPFLATFGPWLQVQILDLAHFLEICNASYMWRNVSSTTYTCFGYFTLFLVSAVPDLQYSMKIFWLACGMFFFLSRPIASCYPRFRHVVDPLRWFFWYQPTMAEHSFRWLREHAQLSLHRPKVDTADPGEYAAVPENEEELDEEQLYFECLSTPPPQYYNSAAEQLALMAAEPALLSFQAHWSGRRGRLEVTRKSVRFVTRGRTKSTTQWEHTMADLLEVRKLNLPLTGLPTPSLTKLFKSSAALSILWVRQDDSSLASTEEHVNDATNCVEETMYGMVADRRDEAFNALIGVSGAMWMELQTEPD